jgi:hypothetical protein
MTKSNSESAQTAVIAFLSLLVFALLLGLSSSISSYDFDKQSKLSARAKLECVDRYCDLLDFLVQEERLKAVALELSIILDENTDDKHLRKALEDSMIRTSASLKILYDKRSALERGRRNN